MQGENQIGSHQKENINAHGTVPFLDKIEIECCRVSKGRKKHIPVFSLQKALTKQDIINK